jgi:8-oxo-dGTP pyrophosphatase MutT (NUDIX family)
VALVSDRPAAGERLGDGPPVVPRLAATVVLLRGGGAPLEVLLVRRTPHARFMCGAWVFPGGAVDPADGAGDGGLRAAARREVAEEAGLRLDGAAELVPFARWITPERIAIRYDTWFFLARAPAGQAPEPDGREIVAARWLTPAGALAEHRAGGLELVFPTRKTLEQLSGFPSGDVLLDWARSHEVRPVLPRVEGSGEEARVVLPDDAA